MHARLRNVKTFLPVAAFLIFGMPTRSGSARRAHGSYAVVLACPQGVYMAADSRTSFGTPSIAYADGMQKVFPLDRDVGIAATGVASDGNQLLSSSIEDFSRTPESQVPLDQILPALFRFIESKWSVEGRELLRTQSTFLAGGYMDGKPTACLLSYRNHIYECLAMGMFTSGVSSQRSVIPAQVCQADNASIQSALIGWIKDNAKYDDNWKEVGGPVSLIFVSQRGWRWITNPPQERWRTMLDIKRAYKAHKLRVIPIPPATRKDVEKIMNSMH